MRKEITIINNISFFPRTSCFKRKIKFQLKAKIGLGVLVGFFLGGDDFFPMAWQKFEPGTGSIKLAPKERGNLSWSINYTGRKQELSAVMRSQILKII